ncbi:MAG: DUF3090 family protein [Actinomycetes bacterium]
MSSSFDFASPDHFTAGAVGPPGQRVFFLQARQGGEVANIRLEKQQVAALSDYLAGILADLPDPDSIPDGVTFIEPAIEEWVVGALAVAYEEDEDRILIVAEELILGDDDVDPDTDPSLVVFRDLDDPASARFRVTRGQVMAFVRHAAQLVVSGRPPCRLCGKPEDPNGHACPRLN